MLPRSQGQVVLAIEIGTGREPDLNVGGTGFQHRIQTPLKCVELRLVPHGKQYTGQEAYEREKRHPAMDLYRVPPQPTFRTVTVSSRKTGRLSE